MTYCDNISQAIKVVYIAARLIFRSPRDSSITALLKELHWLKIEDRVKFKSLTLTWKSLNQLAPDYISELISVYNPTRTLRSMKSLNL